ncbi:MAG: HEAT repeat domain-containing protein [Planctomycetota bacterium]|jgi:HEAT repeat protein
MRKFRKVYNMRIVVTMTAIVFLVNNVSYAMEKYNDRFQLRVSLSEKELKLRFCEVILKDETIDPSLRQKAVFRLINTEDERVVMPLIEALRGDVYIDVRAAAAYGLGEIIHKDAVMPLIDALNDESIRVIKEAVTALGKIKDKRAIPSLIDLLMEDEERLPKQLVVAALSNMKDARVEQALIKTSIFDLNKNVREAARAALGDIEDIDRIPSLIDALRDKRRRVRELAATMLGNTEDKRAVMPLMEGLTDGDIHVRDAVVYALIYLGQRKKTKSYVLTVIENTLPSVDRDIKEREMIVYILGNIKGKRALKLLIFMLPDLRAAVREAVATVLGDRVDRATIVPLIEALTDRDKYVRKAAARSLKYLAIAKRTKADVLKELIKTLTEGNALERRMAARVLGNIGNKEAEEVLTEISISHSSRHVREEAYKALVMSVKTRTYAEVQHVSIEKLLIEKIDAIEQSCL